MRTIGEMIRERREKLGWTQPMLAINVGITQGHLSRIENGSKKPSLDTLQRIAQVLNVTVGALEDIESNAGFVAPDLRRVTIVELDEVSALGKGRVDRPVKGPEDSVMVGLDKPPSVIAVRLRGQSMSPRFHDGDVVIVNPEKSAQPGSFVVADVDGEIVFREYRERLRESGGGVIFDLAPLNSAFSTYRSDVQRIAIVGVAVQLLQDLPASI